MSLVLRPGKTHLRSISSAAPLAMQIMQQKWFPNLCAEQIVVTEGIREFCALPSVLPLLRRFRTVQN